MTDERYKKLMEDVGMPNSTSLFSALHQVANEVSQECNVEFKKLKTEIIAYLENCDISPFGDTDRILSEEDFKFLQDKLNMVARERKVYSGDTDTTGVLTPAT